MLKGGNFSPLSLAERFAFFKDVPTREGVGESRKEKGKGDSEGAAEINQKHLSTLVDKREGVGSLS